MRQPEVSSPTNREVTGADLFALFGSAVGVVGVLYFIAGYWHLNPAAPEEIRQKISQVLRPTDQKQLPTDGRTVYDRSTANYHALVKRRARTLYERSTSNYRVLIAKLTSSKL
jgi:hypothetical protein